MNSAENVPTPGFKAVQEGAQDSRAVLFIDNGHRDRRRERVAVLKEAGFRVHPARSFEQSLSRLGSGAYHLVIASTDGAQESALRFIEEVKRNFPRQLLLVVKAGNLEVPGDYEFSTADPKVLLERVQAMMSRNERSNDQPMVA